jgi:hypothetical protein
VTAYREALKEHTETSAARLGDEPQALYNVRYPDDAREVPIVDV